jgi:hypothetical protein
MTSMCCRTLTGRVAAIGMMASAAVSLAQSTIIVDSPGAVGGVLETTAGEIIYIPVYIPPVCVPNTGEGRGLSIATFQLEFSGLTPQDTFLPFDPSNGVPTGSAGRTNPYAFPNHQPGSPAGPLIVHNDSPGNYRIAGANCIDPFGDIAFGISVGQQAGTQVYDDEPCVVWFCVDLDDGNNTSRGIQVFVRPQLVLGGVTVFFTNTNNDECTNPVTAANIQNLTINVLPLCDSLDFNNDGVSPDTTDINDFLSVFSGGPCSGDPLCNDIDFNNDGVFPDICDIISLLSVFGGGSCDC